MKHPRSRRPRRAYRWEGVVLELNPDAVWARLYPLGIRLPEVMAEFDPVYFPGAQVGSTFAMYVHRRGRKVRTVIRMRKPRPWTQAELDAIDARVAEMSARWLTEAPM